MKTSKIKAVVEVKEFTNDYGVTLYHSLEMENGDKIQIGKKKQQQIGWELTYEIVEEGQHEYNKAKSVQKEEGYTATVKATAPTVDHLKGVKIGHAITNAVSLQCAVGPFNNSHSIETSIKEYAKMIYQISNELNDEI